LFRISIIARDRKSADALAHSLSPGGYVVYPIVDDENAVARVAEKDSDAVLIQGDSYPRIDELAREIKAQRSLPIIALLPPRPLSNADGYFNLIDDFVAEPLHAGELEFRLSRLLKRSKAAESGEELTVGELTIDLAKCEVTVAGRPVMLTFKEYELLKFLVSNRGRVSTREALLNKVWGYDYYGGDRTVDVHIRRLRSKIEDANHTFVETVRNIGYRIRVDQ